MTAYFLVSSSGADRVNADPNITVAVAREEAAQAWSAGNRQKVLSCVAQFARSANPPALDDGNILLFEAEDPAALLPELAKIGDLLIHPLGDKADYDSSVAYYQSPAYKQAIRALKP